jgi:metal-responsive CopG/Arc/MetJ family transcriptional regulator
MLRMKRITVRMPDDLAAALEREAQRRSTSVSAVARDAIEAGLTRTSEPHRFPFVALDASGYRNTARDIEEILKRGWTYERLVYGQD